ncbi:MAG: hypothetical protein R2706_14490 [Acidimicrobiales bacterium]
MPLPAVGRVLIVTSAGPIEVASGDTNTLTRNESWLFSPPQVESASDDDEVVIRVTCEGRMPCRSALTLTVMPGTEVVVIATGGTVLATGLAGDVTIYDGYGDTVLGALSGSVKVVSDRGRVAGSGLSVSELDVSTVSSEVALSFTALPERVLVVTGREATRIRLPEGDVVLAITSPEELQNIEVEPTAGASSALTIRSDGPVSITPPVDVAPKD